MRTVGVSRTSSACNPSPVPKILPSLRPQPPRIHLRLITVSRRHSMTVPPGQPTHLSPSANARQCRSVAGPGFTTRRRTAALRGSIPVPWVRRTPAWNTRARSAVHRTPVSIPPRREQKRRPLSTNRCSRTTDNGMITASALANSSSSTARLPAVARLDSRSA